jgi:hypothetical protein
MKKQPAPEQPSSEEMAQFRAELSHKIQRLVAESIEGWADCANPSCRRARRCASEKRECIARWQASQPPLSEQEAAQRMADFTRDLRARLAGLPIGEASRPREQPRPALPAATAESEQATPPAAHEPKLSPEQQARIDRAWNDYAAEQERPEREPGPRITQL